MSTGANALQPFIERRERNLAWFRKHYPQIAKHFETYKMNRWRVNIMPERDEVDLLAPEGNLYGGSGRDYAHKEVQVFRDAYKEGSPIHSIAPPFTGEFYHPRFVHERINALVSRSPLQRESYSGYKMPNFYPLVVFLGVGIGYHIEEMVLSHEVLSALIVEPDLDKFAGSLYAVDWASIGERIRSRKGQTLHFILGAEENEDLLWAATWNRVTECCPVFPVCTLFYNHQGRKIFDNVSDRINGDMHVYLGSWGHYDDELRQLNNALHNFYLGVKKLPPRARVKADVPVFIFGSGPSVDARIETIRALRDKVIVVSSGSSLRSLEHYGITPDFHVELESDLTTSRVLLQVSEEFRKKVPLIAPSHVSPYVFRLMKEGRFYFKQENPIAQLFGEAGESVSNGTPTCTNAAIAVSIHLGLRDIYLFGMDFGFADHTRHHAEGTVYSREDVVSALSLKGKFNSWELIQVESVSGGFIYTVPTYFNAKRKAEHLIRDSLATIDEIRFHNCSDGAVIENATWIDDAALIKNISVLDSGFLANEKRRFLKRVFSKKAVSLDSRRIDSKKTFMLRKIEEVRDDVTVMLSGDYEDFKGFVNLVGAINAYIEHVLKTAEPGFYFFIRGTLRHFLHVGFTHMLALADEQRSVFFEDWKRTFTETFRLLPEHFRRVIIKPEYSLHSDPWLRQTINTPESYYGDPVPPLEPDEVP